MNRKGSWLVFTLILMVIVACGDRTKYVKSQQVEIEYWGAIEEGQWIEVDGLRFYHATNDTVGGCDPNYEHNYLNLNSDQESKKFYVPATTYLSCLTQGKWAKRDLTNGDMAFNLISALNEFAEQDEVSLLLPYKNTSSVYATTMGKLQIERTDGEPLKVSTSENYKGAVRKLPAPKTEE